MRPRLVGGKLDIEDFASLLRNQHCYLWTVHTAKTGIQYTNRVEGLLKVVLRLVTEF